MTDFVQIKVPMDVPESKLQNLHSRMLEYVSKNSRTYRPICAMDILDMGMSNVMTIQISLEHKGNWQNGAKRWSSRTAFLFHLKKQLNELDIRFELPNQKVALIDQHVHMSE